MKLRYTSLQSDVGAHEETDDYQEPSSLAGTSVVVCELHSQIAAVAVAAKQLRKDCRIAYVMTDQAALPIALSDLVYELKERSFIDLTVTAGQAFGGDCEAVNSLSALGVAKQKLSPDLIIVAQGPGVVGTGTRLGFSGLEVASILNTALTYEANAFLTLRWSDADKRARHNGLSHHSQTILKFVNQGVRIAVPSFSSGIGIENHLIEAVDIPDVESMFVDAGVRVTSMGRTVDQDLGFFQYSAAAGIAAIQ